MQKVSRETCQQYVARRLSEGWRIAGRFGHTVYLSPPDGAFLRPVDLRNDVETLRPNAAGDEKNIPWPSGVSHWNLVDEETPDGLSTAVKSSETDYVRDLYNITDHSVGSGIINHITVYAHCKAFGDITQNSLKIAIKSGSTVSESSEKTVTATFTDYSNQWTTDPNTGSAWTWAAIDALQAGIALREPASGSSDDTWCTQVYVEVDYTAVTEKTSSDAGAGVDALYSLETPEAKSSSDAGSGVESTPMQSAILAGSETGFSIEALIARLLAAVDTGGGVEAGGLLKNLFATEPGRGSDSLTAKIEMPAKGGGMKLWT